MNEDIIDRLQKNLSLLRTCAGWTSQDLANKLGVSRQTISTFERKGTKLTTMQFRAIRDVFHEEIAESSDNGGMLPLVFEALVEDPDKYGEEKCQEILAKAELMAPSVMKKPDERKAVTAAWAALLAASGIVAASAAVVANLTKKK